MTRPVKIAHLTDLKSQTHLVRRAFWHYRAGGPRQLSAFLSRQYPQPIRSRAIALVTTPAADAGKTGPGISKGKPKGSKPIGLRAGYTPSQGLTGSGRILDFEPWTTQSSSPTFSGVTAAVILDDFSRAAWANEFDTVTITPTNWQQTLENKKVDLLFVESAWSGNGGAWKYHLTGPTAPRPPIHELTAWCRKNEITTVFWNKEDPPHFEDFLETAKLFDLVFTSDANLIDEYKRRLGHDRIHVLPFAAQPTIHNPIRAQVGFHERDVAFAGTYFTDKFPERRDQMKLLLTAADSVSSKMERGLEIFSRFLDHPDPRYQFPDPYNKRVVGNLSYDKMLTAYKAYKVFLNVNTVTDSPSMCARRVFEIAASGTPVVTTPSVAISNLFPNGELSVVSTESEAADAIRALVRSKELRDRRAHKAQRLVWSAHTYTHRARQLLTTAGLAFYDGDFARQTVSALVSTNRPEQLSHILQSVAKQVNVDVELILLTHGFEPKERKLIRQARQLGLDKVKLLTAPATWTLGQCLNYLVASSNGTVLTKMDDDDFYGPYYLRDALDALRYSGADIVGKQAHYMYLQGTDATLLRFGEKEHRWTDFIMGPTIMAHRAVFESVPFAAQSVGEDSDFLRRAVAQGKRIYSSDRFNFMQVRRRDVQGHSWKVEDDHLLSTGDLCFYGENIAHVIA